MQKFLKTKNYRLKTNEGFTLIEMMVAVAVFVVVMTIALASFLNISDVQRKMIAFQNINDNLNFALEVITREIRTGNNYSSGGQSFNFINVKGESVFYRLENDSIKRSSDGENNYLQLTSSDIDITDIRFIVSGEASGDGLQPRVTVIINAVAGVKEKTKSTLDLQATVSQRRLDT